ncbi:MAG: hypothetical protein DRJ31_08440 [Candidatus Methanomethylicota archaeon]|uniref:Peptidase S1 domain-containing protein n=1 Tax=Thermoproteota archaeon TaxID=2056631 RepID=A0A497ELE0_9CREN|nr:MAG: hypothetical protein DRJ31_08440 [Candidatus Verstraetearchaeota archaeon]
MAFSRTDRVSKLAGGISIGSEEITAGTLTGRFIDKTDGQIVLVSNWHVFEGKPGETKILQPGPYDGGSAPNDMVGILKRYVELDRRKKMPWWKRIICALFGWFLEEWCLGSKEPNHLDAACAEYVPATEDRSLLPGIYLDDGTRIVPQETVSGDGLDGKKVWKSGRTTGVTVGKVEVGSAKVKVWYGDRWVLFEDVVLVRGECKGGDSGSPVFLMIGDEPSENDKLCGILFAGSPGFFVFCKYKYLEDELKVSWAP